MEELVDIYFLSDNQGNVKIGYSKRVRKRKEQLQTANSNELTLLGRIYKVPKSFEKHIHECATWYHKQGEWFMIDVLVHLMNHPFYKNKINLEKTRETSKFFTN